MRIISAVALASFAFASLSAHAGTPIINLNIGGEISPGVYGQVQFGNAPPPPVVYAQPTIIVQQPPGRRIEPIYLHVPPGHAKHWDKYCHHYNACNRPVYFVRSAEYEPGYNKHRDEGRHDQGHRDDRGDRDHRDDHGDRDRRD